jgi:hypothetical protein
MSVYECCFCILFNKTRKESAIDQIYRKILLIYAHYECSCAEYKLL